MDPLKIKSSYVVTKGKWSPWPRDGAQRHPGPMLWLLHDSTIETTFPLSQISGSGRFSKTLSGVLRKHLILSGSGQGLLSTSHWECLQAQGRSEAHSMPTGSVLEQESRSPPPRENGKAVEAEQGKRGKWSEEE